MMVASALSGAAMYRPSFQSAKPSHARGRLGLSQSFQFLQLPILGWLLALATLAAALICTAGAAQAADVSRKDAADIRAVVQAQLDALAVDDADRAFSFAAPGIRDMMGNAQNFLAMVRTGYPVVHRPASVAFLKAELKGPQVIQAVQMTDAKGVAWLAVYNLQRQPDKSWRISGCVVVPNEGRAV
jgi:Domain of unknown function (DUF4864)